MSQLISNISRAWCRLAHPAPMWPVGGKYRCPQCLKTYPVLWETGEEPAGKQNSRSRNGLHVAPKPAA